MAENKLAVTAGSGFNLHTFQRTVTGPGTVDEQYVLDGEPAQATYMCTSGVASMATASSHLIEIMAGASLPVRVVRLEIRQLGLATTATQTDIYLCRLTSAGTGGTAVVPRPLDAADAAAGATVMRLPSSKGTEGVILADTACTMLQTVGVSTPFPPLIVWDFERLRSKGLIIPAGTTNGIAVVNAAIAGASVMIDIVIREGSY